MASFCLFAQNQDTVNVLRRTIDTTGAAATTDTTKKPDTRNAAFLAKSDSARNMRDTFFLKKKEFTPRGATLRSLILPGWGQAYNKQYWKIPIVAAGIGIPAYFLIDNRTWYLRSKQAANAAFAIEKNPADTALIAALHSQFRASYYANISSPNGLENFKITAINARNAFRKDMDYAIIWTIGLWLLNVADATVFAHLKNFDISDDLSMKVEPVYFHVNRAPGIRLVFSKR